MAVLNIVPGTIGLAALKQSWDGDFRVQGFEEAVIGADFDKPTGVTASGTQYNVRIVPRVTVITATTTSQLDMTNLTYEQGTILSVNDTPTFSYVVVAVPKNLTDRLGGPDTASLTAAYRKLMLGGLMAAVDADSGSLGPGVSTVKGPGNFDQSQILDMQTSLATNARNHVSLGVTPMHLRFHPSQIKYVHNIAAYANADQRGDDANPNVRGVILKAQGLTLAETGNIAFSGGNYWNMMYASSFAVLAYNQTPVVDGTEESGLSMLIKAHADYLNVEVFDEDAVVFKST